MKNYSALIIEDEKPAARSLSRKLLELGFQDIQMLHSVSEARTWFKTHAFPDLIFLDIQLSDGLSFEIFEGLEVKSAIIITTAYDEFALRAFKLNSVDYLLKPISEEDLQLAIDKYERIYAHQEVFNFQQIKAMFTSEPQNYKQRYSIKVGQHIKLVNTADIECFYSENKGTYLYTTDHQNYLLDQTLEQIESSLDPSQFFRINRSHIIHVHSIKNIAVHSNTRLKIQLHHYPQEDLIVSRERVSEFKAWLD